MCGPTQVTLVLPSLHPESSKTTFKDLLSAKQVHWVQARGLLTRLFNNVNCLSKSGPNMFNWHRILRY